MNLVTNELSGIFLLPLAAVLGEKVFELVAGLGLFAIPFGYIIVASTFEARAQGLDEGSPAVLAVKMVEKSFWGFVFIIILALMPVSGKLNVEHRQYSCLDNPSLVGNKLANASTASEDALRALGITSEMSPPMFVGWLHQLSTGMNEAMTSRLTCKKGATGVEVADVLTKLLPENESVFQSIHSFNNQCYKVALTEAKSSIAQNKELRYEIDNKYAWSFHRPPFALNGELINGVYSGSFIKFQNTNPITMDVKETWFDQSVINTNQHCSDMSASLYAKLEGDIRSDPDFESQLNKIAGFTSLFNATVTNAEIVHDMIAITYENAVSGRVANGSQWKAAKQESGWELGLVEPTMAAVQMFSPLSAFQGLSDLTTSEVTDMNVLNAGTTAVVTVGALFNTIVESAKSHAVVLIIPLVVTVFQLILQLSLPILIVISGFSFKFLYNWTLLYFSISLVPLWTSLGIQIETLLLSLSNYSGALSSHLLNVKSGSDMQMYLVSSTAATFVYLIPVIWVMLVQIVGNIAASSFMNAVAGAAIVGQSGGDAVNTTIEDTSRKVSNGLFAGDKNKGSGNGNDNESNA
ncbi:conjugal transfer protein TraG N-terminal domain-containing protein [Enterovibrio norvegicus]|uniref:conjugal transfer protein TraG N-terminal domain-containing protein n=1 Tax=Enterovibrio norvegicus TaxID=188144 RepID=UPI000C85AA1F|nr:conjugal transfer protein TraG N-terminal domain-containing protein [Enterovibrio norvegicus]PMH64459.1 hypothetical protein BCU62_15505 [Enterovibrio norvegicus]